MSGAGRRVVIADDQALFREGLRAVLTAAGVDVVGEAGSGAEAVALALDSLGPAGAERARAAPLGRWLEGWPLTIALAAAIASLAVAAMVLRVVAWRRGRAPRHRSPR